MSAADVTFKPPVLSTGFCVRFAGVYMPSFPTIPTLLLFGALRRRSNGQSLMPEWAMVWSILLWLTTKATMGGSISSRDAAAATPIRAKPPV